MELSSSYLTRFAEKQNDGRSSDVLPHDMVLVADDETPEEDQMTIDSTSTMEDFWVDHERFGGTNEFFLSDDLVHDEEDISSNEASHQGSLKKVWDVLTASQQVLQETTVDHLDPFSSSSSSPSLFLLEPTPLGPKGTQRIVDEVSLADNDWKGDQYWISKLVSSKEKTTNQQNSFFSMPTCTTRKGSEKKRLSSGDEAPLVGEGGYPHERCLRLDIKKPLPAPSTESKLQTKNTMSINDGNLESGSHNSSVICSMKHGRSQSSPKPSITTSTSPHTFGNPVRNPSFPQPQRIASSCAKSYQENKRGVISVHQTTPCNGAKTKMIFRPHQCDQWNNRFEELCDFKKQHGHCLVPHNYPPNPHLAQWIKRQRYQYKLKQLNHHSTLTDVRQHILEEMGFVWDSHKASWTEKLESLKKFKVCYGHCNVPSDYILDHSLAIWVKCQRRQYRLFVQGEPTTMTMERISSLDALEFEWNPTGKMM